jgi:mutator protein MutT
MQWPSETPAIEPVAGVSLAAVEAGIRYPIRRDLVAISFDEGTQVAAVFTRNAFCAAPVELAREHLAALRQRPRLLLINTGNANAGTGEAGLTAARVCCERAAAAAGCAVEEVLPFSTGVIGEDLPVERLTAALPMLLDQLGPDRWVDAGWGILTTDTRPKIAARRFRVDGIDYPSPGLPRARGCCARIWRRCWRSWPPTHRLRRRCWTAPAPRRGSVLSPHQRRWRHLHQRCGGAGGYRSGGWQARRARVRSRSRPRWRRTSSPCASSSRRGWSGTARARASSSRSRSAVAPRQKECLDVAFIAGALAAGEDRAVRRRPQLGPGARRDRPRRYPGPGCQRRADTHQRAGHCPGRWAGAGVRRASCGSGHGRGSCAWVSISIAATAPRPCGPPTCPMTMCASTRSTAASVDGCQRPVRARGRRRVTNTAAEILLTRRHQHSHQGGLWEFPGGKLEANEDLADALRRELLEELAIDVLAHQPLMQIEHDYGDKQVLLDVHRVTAFSGSRGPARASPCAGWPAAPWITMSFPRPTADRGRAAGKPTSPALAAPRGRQARAQRACSAVPARRGPRGCRCCRSRCPRLPAAVPAAAAPA